MDVNNDYVELNHSEIYSIRNKNSFIDDAFNCFVDGVI